MSTLFPDTGRIRAPLSDRRRIARNICRAAALQETPVQLEQFVSTLLGGYWLQALKLSRERGVRLRHDADEFVEAIAHVGGAAAKIALAGLAGIDRGTIGLVALDALESLEAVAGPAWLGEVGRSTVTRALSARSPGEGEALLLDCEPVGGVEAGLGMWIDEPLGDAAKWFQLVGPELESTVAEAGPSGVAMRELDVLTTRVRVVRAIERTETLALEQGLALPQRFIDLRALTLARVTPRPVPVSEWA